MPPLFCYCCWYLLLYQRMAFKAFVLAFSVLVISSGKNAFLLYSTHALKSLLTLTGTHDPVSFNDTSLKNSRSNLYRILKFWVLLNKGWVLIMMKISVCSRNVTEYFESIHCTFKFLRLITFQVWVWWKYKMLSWGFVAIMYCTNFEIGTFLLLYSMKKLQQTEKWRPLVHWRYDK